MSFHCRGEHKMQLRRGTGSGSEEDPTHNGEFTANDWMRSGRNDYTCACAICI